MSMKKVDYFKKCQIQLMIILFNKVFLLLIFSCDLHKKLFNIIFLGLSRRQHDLVKLHMTVVNTVYVQRKKKENAKKIFDATNILKVRKNDVVELFC